MSVQLVDILKFRTSNSVKKHIVWIDRTEKGKVQKRLDCQYVSSLETVGALRISRKLGEILQLPLIF